MGDVVPFDRRHSVKTKYHALWDLNRATPAELSAVVDELAAPNWAPPREITARPQQTAVERYDEALQDLFGLMRPEISNELAATVVARVTYAAIECGLEDHLKGAS